MSLHIFVTTIRLNLIGTDSVNVVFMGPFLNINEMCKVITPTLRGWSKSMKSGTATEEISITIEFNYGDIVYRDIQHIYPPDKGGVDATLFWLDHSVHDWLAKAVPGYYLGVCGWLKEI